MNIATREEVLTPTLSRSCSRFERNSSPRTPEFGSFHLSFFQQLREDVKTPIGNSTLGPLSRSRCSSRDEASQGLGPAVRVEVREPLAPIKSRSPRLSRYGAGKATPSYTPKKGSCPGFKEPNTPHPDKENMEACTPTTPNFIVPQTPRTTIAHHTITKLGEYTSRSEGYGGLSGEAYRILLSKKKTKFKNVTGKLLNRSYLDSTAASRAAVYTPKANSLQRLSHFVKHPQKRKATPYEHRKQKTVFHTQTQAENGRSEQKYRKKIKIKRTSTGTAVKISKQGRRKSSSFHELFLGDACSPMSLDRTRLSIATKGEHRELRLRAFSNASFSETQEEISSLSVRDIATGISEQITDLAYSQIPPKAYVQVTEFAADDMVSEELQWSLLSLRISNDQESELKT